ncbi:hypothetical protein [Eisenibacter elegans]|jgi:hypothetical protein|uniref:hypothetical protein n=1 Tax=Eisenibacter elegans TaxID=997 RepID=UPI00040EFE3D|nr:hypothetical protein [Eisenibacter elegans]
MRKFFYFILLAGLVSACQSGGETNDKDATSGLSEAGAVSCLANQQSKLEQLMSKSFVGQYVSLSEDATLNTSSHQGPQNGYLNKAIWTWTLGERTVEGTAGVRWRETESGFLGISGFTTFVEGSSVDGYDGASAAEYLSLLYRTEERVAVRPVAQNDDLLSPQEREIAKGLEKQISYNTKILDVPEVGDAARWDVLNKTLLVAHKNVLFGIRSQVEADEEANIALAVKIARDLLKKCH